MTQQRRIVWAIVVLAVLALVAWTTCRSPGRPPDRRDVTDHLRLVFTGKDRQVGDKTIRTRGYLGGAPWQALPLVQADEEIDPATGRVLSRMLILPDRIIVRLSPEASIESVMTAMRNLELPRAAFQSLGMPQWYSIRFDIVLDLKPPLPWDRGWDIEEILQKLRSLNGVTLAEPDCVVQALPDTGPPCAEDGTDGTDPMFGHQWGLKKIKAPEAWSDGYEGNSATLVALVDSGIDYGHIDLDGQVWINDGEYDWAGGNTKSNCVDDDGNGYADDWRGWDFVDQDNDPFDETGHGTHVAGIIGAEGGNNAGGYGVCWPVSLMALRVFNKQGYGSCSAAVKAINYAIAKGAHVINCSWEVADASQALETAIDNAGAQSILVVAAAGNGGSSTAAYPAGFSAKAHVIGVAATKTNDALLANSNYGKEVEIAAPGDAICSTLPCGNGLYGMKTGTSMACAFVSGVAALMKSETPGMPAADLKLKLLATADIVNTGVASPVKRVNALAALKPLP